MSIPQTQTVVTKDLLQVNFFSLTHPWKTLLLFLTPSWTLEQIEPRFETKSVIENSTTFPDRYLSIFKTDFNLSLTHFFAEKSSRWSFWPFLWKIYFFLSKVKIRVPIYLFKISHKKESWTALVLSNKSFQKVVMVFEAEALMTPPNTALLKKTETKDF